MKWGDLALFLGGKMLLRPFAKLCQWGTASGTSHLNLAMFSVVMQSTGRYYVTEGENCLSLSSKGGKVQLSPVPV